MLYLCCTKCVYLRCKFSIIKQLGYVLHQGCYSGDNAEKWINDEEAMTALNIKSKTTLQKLRDEGKIRFSQPQKKIILYDKSSIDEYLDKHAHETF